MQNADSHVDALADEDIDRLWIAAEPWLTRFLRGALYATIAALLLSINSYGLYNHRWVLALCIGVMGAGNSTARYGRVGLCLLLVLAILSPDVIKTLAEQFQVFVR